MISNQSKIHLARLLPFFIFLVGMWYFGVRILGLDLGYLPGDLGDSRFINYLLEHNYQWLTGNADSFWDAGFMYPYKNTIAISDNMLGTGPIYALWRMVGFAQETAFQFWWLTICALNYWGTYLVIKNGLIELI